MGISFQLRNYPYLSMIDYFLLTQMRKYFCLPIYQSFSGSLIGFSTPSGSNKKKPHKLSTNSAYVRFVLLAWLPPPQCPTLNEARIARCADRPISREINYTVNYQD